MNPLSSHTIISTLPNAPVQKGEGGGAANLPIYSIGVSFSGNARSTVAVIRTNSISGASPGEQAVSANEIHFLDVFKTNIQPDENPEGDYFNIWLNLSFSNRNDSDQANTGAELLKSGVIKMLSILFAHPRTFIIIFNKEVTDLLADFVVDIDNFAIKADDPLRRGEYHFYSFTRLSIRFSGVDCIFGVADSIYNSNMSPATSKEYGLKALEIIKRGFFLNQPLWNFKSNH